MPTELTSKDELKKLLKDASEIRIVKRDEKAKIKVRTKKALYTFKTTGEDADQLVKGLKTTIVEF